MKKFISLLLSILMLFSLLLAHFNAFAAYDTLGTARPISFDTTYSGSLSASNSQDWYKFSISSSGRITLNATHYTSGYNARYEFYNTAGDKIYYNYSDIEYKSSLGYATGQITVYLYAGTFYFKTITDGSSSRYGNYNFSLQYQDSNESFIESAENNDDYIGTANDIQLNKKYFGQLGVYDDYDFYRFSFPISSTVTLKATHYTSGYNARYEIFDIDGDKIWYDYSSIEFNNAWGYSYGSVDISLSPGTYYLKTITDGSSSRYGFYNFSLNLKVNVGKPSYFSVDKRNKTSLELKWGKVSGASGYQLQKKSGGSWKTQKNTKSTNYTVSDLKSGTKYEFRVRAYKKISDIKYYSGWKTLTTATKPSTPSIKSPSTNKKHQIIAKWNAVSRCSGYQVQFSRNRDFSSVIATKTVSGKNNTSYTGNNFTKGKTYYIRVRAYKSVDGTKYYSSWSKVKSIKCK